MPRHLLTATVLVLAVLTGCGGTASAGGFVAGDGTVTQLAPDRRGAPVDVTGQDLDGARIDLATLRGKPVVVNVWGSWCPPCRKEAPDLVRAAAALAPVAAFVGLDTRDSDTAQARAFVRTFAVTYPSLFDPDGRLLLAFGGAVPPNAIPSTLVLDAQGRVAARVLGPVGESTLVELVRDVAAGR